MENLISLIHKIERAYTALADQGLDSALPTDWDELPSIAVVGGQSSGKSSVLEMIIGKDCIPKGKGMATRRPLVLQLHRIDGTREYAQFLHQPGKTYRSSAEVRKEIADETCRETGLSKPISSVPIHLSIFAQNVVNLTLIDLPGLSKTAAGERTFGILTKLDLMPEGTHAVDVLEGKICRLQYPWIGVVNQSQDDMDMDMGIDLIAARRRELEYFGSIPEYKHLAHRMGSQHLVRALAKHFVSVLKTKLPYDYLFSGSSISSEASKKNCLQTYSLRAYGTPPIYQLCVEGEGHKMTFQCGVKVSGKVYWSAKGHSHSKHAEEEAACVACTALMGNESMETLFALIEKGSICKVMLLSQYALKKGLGAPLYGSSRVAAECQLTQWLSTVSLDGRIFIGDAANKKRASLQSAAFAAVQSLLEDGDDMMLKVVLSKSVKVKVPRKKKPKSNCASVIKSNGASIKNIGKKRKLIVESLVAESEESDAS